MRWRGREAPRVPLKFLYAAPYHRGRHKEGWGKTFGKPFLTRLRLIFQVENIRLTPRGEKMRDLMSGCERSSIPRMVFVEEDTGANIVVKEK